MNRQRIKTGKLEVKEFIEELLRNGGCKGIHDITTNVNCQCPFHWPRKNVTAFGISFENEAKAYPYRCYSCHEVGNIFTLIAHLNKCSYTDAQKLFSKKVAIKPINLKVIKESFNKMKRSSNVDKEPIVLPPRFNSPLMSKWMRTKNIFQHEIMNVPYVISKYDLYYCDSGLYKKRIIMPIRDENGRYIFFTNRSVSSNYKKNIFPKGHDATDYIYGLFEAIGRKKVIIIEGPFDLYQLKSFAIQNNINEYGFICIMGTVMTELRASIISTFFEEAYLLFDYDDAGLDGEEEANIILRDYMDTHCLTKRLYKGKDPGNSSKKQLKKVFAYKPSKRVLASF